MWNYGEMSLAYLTVDGASPIEHVEAAAAAGFTAAGLRILAPSHLPKDGSVVGNARATKLTRSACDRLGVMLLDAEVMCLNAGTSYDDVNAMVDTATELGFRFVQTVVEDSSSTRAAEKLALLADVSRAAGIGVALEFMIFRPLKNIESALSLIDQSGADNIGIVIDALHLARSGGSPSTVATIPGDRIAMLQLCDAPLAAPANNALTTEARCGRLHPGEGELWLHELLDVLPDGLPISIEVPHPSFGDIPYSDRATQAKTAVDQFLERRESSGTKQKYGS